jgi:hypothetical protein
MQEHGMFRSVQNGVTMFSEQLVGKGNRLDILVVGVSGAAGKQGNVTFFLIIDSDDENEELSQEELVSSSGQDLGGLEKVIREHHLTVLRPADTLLVAGLFGVDGDDDSFLGDLEGILVGGTPGN